jgi:UDP-glucose 4-epimerase
MLFLSPKMKILITGAAGFIGSQLAYRLWREGEQVFLLDNFSYGKEDNLVFPDKDFREEIIRDDIRNKDVVESLIRKQGIEAIFHIAGIAPLPDCQSRPEEAVDVNVTGTVVLLEAARKYGVKKFVFASTNAMYENDTTYPTREDGFVLPTLVYPNTKYCAERFCQSFADTYGLSVTALRFANVYGPHIDVLRKQPPFVGYMIRELYYDRTPTFYSDGEQSRDYIYVEDLITLALMVLRGTSTGFEALNTSSNASYSVKELYTLASRLMDKNIEAQFVGPHSYWSSYSELYSGALPIKPEILDHEVNKETKSDNSLAKSRYGWEPQVSIEEGLTCSITYIQDLLKAQS